LKENPTAFFVLNGKKEKYFSNIWCGNAYFIYVFWEIKRFYSFLPCARAMRAYGC
jgi:hypothetical protein